jgi:hypothetical protein
VAWTSPKSLGSIFRQLGTEIDRLDRHIAQLYDAADPKGIVASAPGIGAVLSAGIQDDRGSQPNDSRRTGALTDRHCRWWRHAGTGTMSFVPRGRPSDYIPTSQPSHLTTA